MHVTVFPERILKPMNNIGIDIIIDIITFILQCTLIDLCFLAFVSCIYFHLFQLPTSTSYKLPRILNQILHVSAAISTRNYSAVFTEIEFTRSHQRVYDSSKIVSTLLR